MNNDEKARITNRLPFEAEQGRLRGGQRLIEATHIAGSRHIAGIRNQITEPNSRKERACFNELIRPLEEQAMTVWASNLKII